MRSIALKQVAWMLTLPDHRLDPVRRIYLNADTVQSVLKQDGQTRNLSTMLHDHMGHHFRSHWCLPKLCWPCSLQVHARLHRGGILPRLFILPQFLVYEEGAWSSDCRPLLRQSYLRCFRRSSDCWYYWQHERYTWSTSMEMGVSSSRVKGRKLLISCIGSLSKVRSPS